MIPLRLRLKNFLGYRNEQELSLDGIHLACLSGDNGAGKSSLLDAMTWALWGQARGRTADELVHLGQTDTEVELEFGVEGVTSELGQVLYRVLRKHRRGTPGHPSQSIFELYTASSVNEDREWRPITGNSLRDTQHKIEEILRLDYDTFINSAFILQGRADEFTIKTPSKRKELLAEILGLSFYDELEKRAKEKRRESENQMKFLDLEVENILNELVLQPSFESELKQAQEALSSLEPQLRTQEAALTSLRQKQGELEAKKEELKRLSIQKAQTVREANAKIAQLQEHQKLIQGFETLLSQRNEIEEYYKQLQETRKENELWNDKSIALNPLQREENQLKLAISDARSVLERDITPLKKQITDLEMKVQTIPKLQQSLTQGQAWLNKSLEQESVLKQKRQSAQDLHKAIGGLQVIRTQMENDISSLKEKIILLGQADAHCPLCEAELGTDGKKLLETKYRTEIQVKSESRDASVKDIVKYQKEYQTLVKDIEDGETKLWRERDAGNKRIALLEKQLSEAESASSSIEAEREKLSSLEKCLNDGQFAQDEQSRLNEIEKQISALAYDYVKHQNARKSLQVLEPIENRKRRLDDAAIRIQSENMAQSQTQEACEQVQGRQHELEQKIQDLTVELAGSLEIEKKLQEASDFFRTLTEHERSHRDRISTARNNLNRYEILEINKTEKETQRVDAAKQEGIYRELAEAFGKKGVPALLIEAALPELETEANQLLSRMTDNRLHIKLETQRDAKSRKGETIETLDIKISDELGTRDYEMFSGGEAFRINLALRIALSKLLARRAGAPLPTLVIDEGFGTQDSNGREKLVEAINSIQDDFEKILVITHIEELKDLFPVRIEVTKTSEGSIFRVVE